MLGWRLWRVRLRGGAHELVSWSHGEAWPARERLEARCDRLLGRCGEAPRLRHSCGIYAVRTREAAEALLRGLPRLPGPFAIGRVSLWGRVIENVGGWRAQFAYPYELQLIGADAADAQDLRRRYAVDVDVI
jgi:hypothetical protein